MLHLSNAAYRVPMTEAGFTFHASSACRIGMAEYIGNQSRLVANGLALFLV